MTIAAVANVLHDAFPATRVVTGGGLDGYQVAGMRPAAAVRPATADAVAELLRLARAHGWRVAPVGGGTMLDLGNPPSRLDLVVDLASLDAVVDYQPDDLTLTVQAGVTVDRVNRLLAQHGQLLPLDVPLPERATVGGALACDVSGPLSLRFGTARDLVIGMQAALPRHGLARSGGKVVKNVAGYDLAKLHIGGLGTLGIITEVTFKLWPAPPGQGALVAAFNSLPAAEQGARQILAGQLFPAALELANSAGGAALLGGTRAEPEPGQWLLAVWLLGALDAVQRQTRELVTLCTQRGAPVVTALEPEERARLFDGIRDCGRADAAPAAMILRASVLPSQTAAAIAALERAGEQMQCVPVILARPGRGSARGFWRSVPPETALSAVNAARDEVAALGGQLIVERVPAGPIRGLDAWGSSDPDLELMRRLKQAYDPERTLNPGRFVGGI